MQRDSERFRTVIGVVLRYGVVASFFIVALGSILLFTEGQTGYSPLESTQSLVGHRDASLVGLGPLLDGVAAGRPYALIDLGLLILLATPLARVAISIPLFLEEGSYAFVAITTTVLAILLLSIFAVAPVVAS